VPYFICPNCKERTVDIDGKEGFTNQAAACRHCGFGFLFELLEDYYPAPNTGLIACDAQSRVLSAGRGVFELTGYEEGALLGRDVTEALGLSGFEDGRNPAQIATEWGVRRLGEKLVLRTRGGLEKPVTADFFPAYDADGGLLVALTPRSNGAG
jgi:PAS domain-containing protein